MHLPVYNNLHYTNMLEHLHVVLTEKGLSEAINVYYTVYPIDCLRKGGVMVNNLTMAHAYYQARSRREKVAVRPWGDFVNVPKAVTEWVVSDDLISLVLYGSPGSGKTQLAMTAISKKLGSPKFLLVSDKNQLGELAKSPPGTGIIFDDVVMTDFGREGLIHLTDVDQDRVVRVLYGVAEIPAGTVKIFTLNTLAALTQNDRAIERRVMTVELTKSVIPGHTLEKSIADKRIHSFCNVADPVILKSNVAGAPDIPLSVAEVPSSGGG